MDLTPEQLAILGRFRLRIADVLDATGMATRDYKAALREQGLAVAFCGHAAECNKGHSSRFRLSSGHCLECSPQGLAYWQRHQKDAFVYVARSRKLGLLKIGTSGLQSIRMDGLNRDGYGGATDWEPIYWRKYQRAGQVEARTQAALHAFQTPVRYLRLGHGEEVTAIEMFRCELPDILEAMKPHEELALASPWTRS